MSDLASVHAIVSGRVQGIFFRDFTSRHARSLGLTGYVRNLPDRKTVEVQAEGERNELEKLINYLQLGPPAAKVAKVTTIWSKYTGNYTDFQINY